MFELGIVSYHLVKRTKIFSYKDLRQVHHFPQSQTFTCVGYKHPRVAAKNLLHAEIADKVNHAADKIYLVSFVQRFEEFRRIQSLRVSFEIYIL